MNTKTVYVLGAGFSKDAGASLQSAIVDDILELEINKPFIFATNKVKDFKDLLSTTFVIPDELQRKVPLEDIFTPLDKCIADNISFRNLSIEEVRKKRELVNYLIGVMLKEKLQNISKNYVDNFATYLFDQCKKRKNRNYDKVDTVSVISTNWDILLDNSLKAKINASGENAVVDYCCYISSYKEHDQTVKPGLEILGMGGFNIKLLKLHGSYNWLQCPRCLRVYVDFDQKIAVNQYELGEKCRHCNKNFGYQESHKLISNLIMPTFLKDFSNPQYKLIWQNAGIELSEADNIVFIGYSLPEADFEMRQLLARMVRDTATIEVVTKGPADKQSTIDLVNRYEVFFGRRKPNFHFEGVVDYINNNLH